MHSTLHGRVLNECLMRAECVKFFLDVDDKSMFVRLDFKALVKKHLIAIIECLNNNDYDNDNESRHRIASIGATFAAMSVRNRLSNMDIFSDVISEIRIKTSFYVVFGLENTSHLLIYYSHHLQLSLI